MGQKCNPISNRLGIIRGWDSNWYGGRKYAERVAEDAKIRKYLTIRLSKASVSKIIIERTIKMITITVNTAKPGFVIGKDGTEVELLRKELNKITKKDIQINIFELRRPELEAQLVADDLARKLEAKTPYRKAIKTAISNIMRTKVEGIKIQISGRLNGAEMARSEMYKEGRTPLHTLRADIDYALAEALTKTGLLGIKVWICRGEIYGKRDLSPNVGKFFGDQNRLKEFTPRQNSSFRRNDRNNDRPNDRTNDRRNERNDRSNDRRSDRPYDKRNDNRRNDHSNNAGGDKPIRKKRTINENKK